MGQEQGNQSDQDRVVITAAAALTPIGLGYAATRAGLRRGVSGIGTATVFADEPALRAVPAGELPDFDARAILGAKGLRNKDRLTLMLLSCVGADLAEQIAGLTHPEEVGLVAGTTFSSLNSQVEFTAAYERGGSRALNAMAFPNMVLNTAPSQANIWFGLSGMSTTLTNGFTAGLDAVLFAADQLRVGRVQQVLAGGADDLAPMATQAFAEKGYLSSTGCARPFDRRHDGTLLGEGAAMVLLETRGAAEARGATVLAEIVGHASTFDGGAEPGFNGDAEGAARAMTQALAAAELQPDDIDFVAASASGYPPADRMEATALRRVFGPRAESLPIAAYKAYFGECLGASSALQLVAALADLQDGIVSATPGFEQADADSAHALSEPLTGTAPKTVLINAFGYTGNNTSMIIRQPAAAP